MPLKKNDTFDHIPDFYMTEEDSTHSQKTNVGNTTQFTN